ncbi:DUF397 domain-containing protein [Streptomyces sp. Tu6071]|uniref:DUF397 domain-containing protein n=1 Tax=Streptomyces sp. Tu6071 TaxID=355249 RepID=UPI0002EA2084|nr:DUF397 domain-containing protein [Streptomyces sp. Tu6071]
MTDHVTPPAAFASNSEWRRSTYSDQTGGNCVEIARHALSVGVRDSKQSAGAVLVLPSTAFDVFMTSVKDGNTA